MKDAINKIDFDNLNIQVDTKKGRLFFPIVESRDAELHFMVHTDGQETVIEFTHTYVPEVLRHQGLGTRLVEKGMQLAQNSQYEVDATCPFVKDFLSKHPEFDSLRVAYNH